MTKKEFLEKADRITAQIKQNLDTKIEIKENTFTKEIKIYEHNNSELVFNGDVYIKGNLDQNWFQEQLKDLTWESRLSGFHFMGNVFVEGDVIDDDYLELQVNGNLTCNYFYSNDGHQFIGGDLTAKFGIYGEYNDGSLEVEGKVTAPYLVSDDHDMPKQATSEYIYIESGSICNGIKANWGWGWDYFDDSEEFYQPKLWDDEEEKLSVESFFEIVRKGENPFKLITNY